VVTGLLGRAGQRGIEGGIGHRLRIAEPHPKKLEQVLVSGQPDGPSWLAWTPCL
jgi:hypothetical protein